MFLIYDMILTNDTIYNDIIYSDKWLEYFLWSLRKHFIRLYTAYCNFRDGANI